MPKDPASLRLRSDNPRVMRISRKVLIGLGAVGGLAVGGALIYALQNQTIVTPGEELYSTANRTTADGLATLPKDYTGPPLGPPLPGDLGGPILDAQNRGKPVQSPIMPNPGISAEEQRRQQEIEAARVSKLFTESEGKTVAAGNPELAKELPAQPGTGMPDLVALGLAPPLLAQTAQDKQTAFLNAAVDRRVVAPDRIMPPASPNILQAGSVIAAALLTGIRSDLPGQLIAQVTENVYDSPTGRILLIPQGARLIGQYDSSVTFGQRRILLVWNRLIMPNGRSIVLERQPGADSQGYAGLEDGVDYHWGDLFKAAALSTLLSVGAELGTDNDDRLVRALRGGAQDTISDAGQQIVRRQLNIAPTLTIRPGFPVRVMVTRDLVLEAYGER